MRKLILGSTSKPRLRLLQRLLIPFEVAAPDVDETPYDNEPPSQLVTRLAEMKARKVAEQYPDAVIIGADQVGVLNNEILCKPHTHEIAVNQLQKMSGKHVEFLVGMTLLDSKTQVIETILETYAVTFRDLKLSMIEIYLQKEDALQCSGSFKAEGLGIALVSELHGNDFSALIGLPLIRLTGMLEKVGLEPLSEGTSL